MQNGGDGWEPDEDYKAMVYAEWDESMLEMELKEHRCDLVYRIVAEMVMEKHLAVRTESDPKN